MKISRQAKRDAKELFRACMVNGALDEARVRRAVAGVLDKKPRGYLAVLSQFQRLVKLEQDRRTARVESAAPLAPEVEQQVKESLNRVYGSGLHIQFAQRPELIGGLRIQVGSDVYDGSVRARLNRLEQSFQV